MDYRFPSIAFVLEWAVRELKQGGVDNPRLDAEVLLAHSMNTDRLTLYREPLRSLDWACEKTFRQYLARRARREPVAYITGIKEFRSLVFKISPDVLIPRPETETIIDVFITLSYRFRSKRNKIRILDVGTGCGAIAVSLAKELDSITVIATDCALSIVTIAWTNAQLHGLNDKICFLVGDLLKPVAIREQSKLFDCILSNPPYLSDEEWNQAQPEIKQYEPERALRAGHDGLAFYKRLVPEAVPLLSRRGYLLFEVGQGKADPVANLIQQSGLFDSVSTVRDLSGIERVVMAQKR